MKTGITSCIESGIFEDFLVAEGNEEEVQYSLLMTTTKFLFLILYYYVTKERHRNLFHVMNAHAIYERCRSREK